MKKKKKEKGKFITFWYEKEHSTYESKSTCNKFNYISNENKYQK